MIERTINDNRRIKALYYNSHDLFTGYVCTEQNKPTCLQLDMFEICDLIEPYEENGEMAPQTWFAIYKGGAIWRRVSGKDVTVEY